MKINQNFLFILLVMASFSLISCNKTKDDPSVFTLPDLEFSVVVTGDASINESFSSPENNNTKGGHSQGLLAVHSKSVNAISITSAGDKFAFSAIFNSDNVEKGSFALESASFTDPTSGANETYANFQSGTVTIDNASLNDSFAGGTYYTISGNFTAEIMDQSTPAKSISVVCEFTNLNVTSN